MKDRVYLTELILNIESNGEVRKVYFKRIEELNFKNIYDVIDLESLGSFTKFLERIKENEVEKDCVIVIKNNGQYMKYLMTGIKCDENILLIFFNDLSEVIANELIKINNEQLNTLRIAIKELTDKKQIKISSEEQILNEMTELNNRLINMQRELTKKNIELDILNKKLNEISITDPLTGVYNRRYFFSKIKEEISRAKRENYKISLISIDLNNFKKVNDNYGHDEGDRVLKEFTKKAQQILRRDIDSIYRFGGDEFIVLLIDCNIQNAENVVKRLNEEVRKINNIISLSYGIEEIDFIEDLNDSDLEKILIKADKKMYELKNKFKSACL